MSVLTGSEAAERGIVRDLTDPQSQIQPAGIDLTIDKVEKFRSGLELLRKDFSPSLLEIVEASGNIFILERGAYKATFSETIEIPSDVVGLVFPRSSLLRSGVTVQTALWDPGYKGKGSVLLLVFNSNGAKMEKGARVAQLMLLKLSSVPDRLYQGSYQGEGLGSGPTT